MHSGRIVFSQLIDFLPKHQTFSCFDQYLCMAFAQITYRQSLRDIETCLRAMQPKLYHCGIRGNASRNTLAKANENRDWRISAEFAQVLINKARKLYANEYFGIQLKQATYALDSTTIDLCLSLFPWAKFRKHKAAVKVHTLMDLRGSIPSFIRITDRNLLQVDQAIPAYQNIFWHKRECRKDSNMDCCQRLRSGSYCQERTPNQAEFGRNFANSQHCAFRESPYDTSTYEKYVAKQILSIS
jgi:hypothetical protein